MRTIQGVNTSTAGFIGVTESGPTIPEIVTSWTDFQNKFGSYISESYLPYAVNGFFTNGGQRCFVGRATTNADYEELLNAFKEIAEISILQIPNAGADRVKSAIAHCENLKDRFLIIDSEQGADISSLQPRDRYGNSRFAAFYYPWIKILDPVTGTPKLIPPGGCVAGIFARKDVEHGVHKAPADEVVRGAIDLEFNLNLNDQRVLAPRSVNAIRNFPGKGILLWGVRTLSDQSDWKYVNVRRLITYIEQSIGQGTRWAVSEPNDESLWAEVRASINEFLTQRWRAGALQGIVPEKAFFIKCDRTTMTQQDIDNGRLICVIGVAPVRPAEFVIFRIGQWTGGTDIDD